MAERREPQPNVMVYELGHYEQMQLDMVVTMAITDDESEYDLLLDGIDTDCLATLKHIFASGGTIAIIRKDDSE